MSQAVLLTFFLDVALNALLSFGTALLVIEILLAFFRAPHERLRTFLRLVPIIKLPVDLLRYDFQAWALFKGIDPALEPKGTRVLSASFDFTPFPSLDIGCHLESGQKFSLMDFALSSISKHALLVESLLLAGVIYCLILLSIRIYTLRIEQRRIDGLIEKGICFQPKIDNVKLQNILHRTPVNFLLTQEATIPFAYARKGNKWIVFPEGLLRSLKGEESEAIIAHEISHIIWKDAGWQIVLQLFRCLFFWIPMQAMIKRLHEQREYACDRFAISLGISSLSLASAMTKSARASLRQAPSLAVPWTSKGPLRKRIEHLLGPKKKLVFLQTAVLSILASALLFGKLWIF